MLNRLYIVVGVLAILALAAAFVVPSLVDWGLYRERMAAIAGEVLGAPVRIEGDVKFTLLPQPRLEFAGVSAGAPDAPRLTVAGVVAEFSLIDFLRDRYTVTRLVLDRPALSIRVASDGSVDAGLAPPRQVSTSNVAVASAEVIGGVIEVGDARPGDTYPATDINGELRLEALRGPYAFPGRGQFDGAGYQLRLTTGAIDDAGSASLAATLRPDDGRYVLTVEGSANTGLSPSFSGILSYRQPPRRVDPEGADAGRGDLVMTGKLEASPARVLLSDYVVVPDENRPATRLLGAAEVTLGAGMAYNAVVSGGVMTLPPRDATAEQAVEPYEIVRLLRELPIPAPPALAGSIGIDIAELNLRAFSLRNVRLDARSEAGGWQIRQFRGELPGGSRVELAGNVTRFGDHSEFSGTLSISTERLDLLSALWRKPSADTPLFNLPGSLTARVDLIGETLTLSDGQLTLDGESRTFGAQIGIGSARDIQLNADLGRLDAGRSAALFALLPDLVQDAAFPVTFPKGEFSVIADELTLAGLAGRQLALSGSWDGGVLVLDRFTAGNLGGAAVELSLTAFGSFERPELSGTGTIRLTAADAPVLGAFYDAVGTPLAVRSFIAASIPLDLAARLGAPSGQGAQSLSLAGTLGSADVSAEAQLEAGFLRALSGSIRVELELRSADAAALTAQLGLGNVGLLPQGEPVHLVAVGEGNAANSIETTLRLEGGGDSVAFAGNVVVSNPDAYSARGTLKATLSDPSGLADWLGAGGLSVPPLSASAQLDFDGNRLIRLSAVEGKSGGEAFTGRMELNRSGSSSTVSGEIVVGRLDVGGLLGSLVGPAALIEGEGLWPEGPFATGDAPRTTSGRIRVTTPELGGVGPLPVTDLAFDFDWDPTAVRLRGLGGTLGGGRVGLELAVCCAGLLPDKQVTGRISLQGVSLDSLAPAAVADALEGTITAAGRFEGTGSSVAEVLEAMTGEGTYAVDNLTIARLDPLALASVAAVDEVLEMQPEDLTSLIAERLDDGPLISEAMSGAFTIAGGVVRSPNVTIAGQGGALFGGSQVRLSDLGLSGSYVLSASGAIPAAMLGAASAEISTRLSGTLMTPGRSFDVSALVDAVMVRAYEAEVARLELLRAEEEARQQAAKEAEELRLAEEAKAREEAELIRRADEAARQAAEQAAARQAAEEAAARQAAEDAARKRAAEAAARKKAEEAASQPMDLGLGN
ncbi:MAG: AsmA family protein [Devosia sp.]|nr:AsmA family protein [Devosia sp.]